MISCTEVENLLSIKRIDSLTWPAKILNLVGMIREYKGKESLFMLQTPEVLETLKRIALMHSVESSNHMDGMTIPHKRLALLIEGVRPQSRQEAETAGHHAVLCLVHKSARQIPLQPDTIRKLHMEMMQYGTDHKNKEILPFGEEKGPFSSVPDRHANEALDELVKEFRSNRDQEKIDELILIGIFIFDFIRLRPFNQSNERMSRMLALLLLYQAGFNVGRYISLDKAVEETKEQYYETLIKSSISYPEDTSGLYCWLEYFFTVLFKCYQRFEERVGLIINSQRGWKEKQIKTVVEKMITNFTIQHVLDSCPGISRSTIQRVLNQLSHEQIIECMSRGRNAQWKKV
jgi:Fic family protein